MKSTQTLKAGSVVSFLKLTGRVGNTAYLLADGLCYEAKRQTKSPENGFQEVWVLTGKVEEQ